MDENELADLEGRLRDILVLADLQWILTSIDAAIHAGISSEKGIVIREARGWRRDLGEEEVARVLPPGSRERPQRTMVTNEPFTSQQRVELLISSIKQATVELPSTQEETLKLLNSTAGYENESVNSVQFKAEVDTDTSGPPQLAEVLEPEASRARARAVSLLDAFLVEVRG